MLKKHRWFIIVFAVALGMRILVMAVLVNYQGEQGIITGDAAKYISLAKHIASGDG